MTARITLKAGKDKALRLGHPWIFSGAIASGARDADGSLYPVYSSNGDLLGSGYFNARSSIIGRMVCFGSADPIETIKAAICRAVALRKTLFMGQDTDGYRVINGEGDFLPGLVVDRYGDTLVVQISTKGIELLRDVILETLIENLHPEQIYEKSTMPSRAEEGLQPYERWHRGGPENKVLFSENGMRFYASVVEGQKSGFFLDQREMRQQIRRLAKGRRVLNCFSYSGAFTVAALMGGAAATTSVDVSSKALDFAKDHVALNGFDADGQSFRAEDVFDYLRQDSLDYGLVILDPPAFSKKRHDVVQACRGYKDINRLAMKGMPSGSYLLTSSCSHFVDDGLFQKVVFQASVEAGKRVQILDRHHYAADHPENICHPEGHYLKSLLLWVSDL